MIDGCVSSLSDRTTFISFQLNHHTYEQRPARTKTIHVQRTNSGGGSLGLGPMYELNCEFDLLILVGWRFRRRVGFWAASPYTSPVSISNLYRTRTRMSVAPSGYSVKIQSVPLQ